MKPFFPLVLLVLSLILAGCKSPASKVNQLNTGMSKAQVVELLGPPRNTTATGDEEVLRFELLRYRPPIRWPIYEEYLVKLFQGHVTAFGKPRDLARAIKPVK
jgi:hypothetical protein